MPPGTSLVWLITASSTLQIAQRISPQQIYLDNQMEQLQELEEEERGGGGRGRRAEEGEGGRRRED